MRILMLSQFVYPPTFGGEERFVIDLSQELASRGHEISLVTYWQKGFPEFEIQKRVRIHRVRGTLQNMSFLFSDNTLTFAPPFPDPGVMRELRRIILGECPDIIHAHNWIVHSITPLKLWSKAKLVVSLHDYSLICVQKRLMRRGISCTGPGIMKCLACGTNFYGIAKGPLATFANFYWGKKERHTTDMFLPVSHAVVEGCQLDKHQVSYRIVSNFIPDHIDVISDNDNTFLTQLPEGDFLLFVGTLTVDKGVEVLLQAYAEMDTRIPLVLIGRQVLPDIAKRLPKNVFLMGSWPHDAVMRAWSRCTIGLVPSIVADACPTVAMESMVMGRPIIATRNGGLTDIVIDGETGLLVPPGDPQALRLAMQTLLDDPALRESMSALAKQRVIEFQAKSVISRFEQVYHDLLEADSTTTHTLVNTESM